MTVAQTRSLSALSSLEPLVAVFAIILAVVSPWSSKRRPWIGGKDRMTVAKGFLVASLPFVLAEAGDSLGADRPAVDTAGGRDGDGCRPGHPLGGTGRRDAQSAQEDRDGT
jgi:hypothetical protein